MAGEAVVQFVGGSADSKAMAMGSEAQGTGTSTQGLRHQSLKLRSASWIWSCAGGVRSDLRLKVVVFADPVKECELALQPVDVFLFAF